MKLCGSLIVLVPVIVCSLGGKQTIPEREGKRAGSALDADFCKKAVRISGEGLFDFDNADATLDGPPHTACITAQEDQIDHDIWACWTSPCTGTVFVRTCGLTGVDTKLAVYYGCTCPERGGNLRTCNDDGCGGTSVQSQLTFDAAQGMNYLLRIGTFPGSDGGTGAIEITCGTDNCPSSGSCLTELGKPGCEDQSCCETVCSVDGFCCSEVWDDTCAAEAAGLCGDGFGTCSAKSGSCYDPAGNITAGCSDEECCNIVCQKDPFCCISRWDDVCASHAAVSCRPDCFSTTEACDTPHSTPGCAVDACCSEVCPRDPFCCQTEWDAECVSLAKQHCP
jgi:hypothetical protein